MALLIGDNFNYQGQKPNFERDSFDTLESMISYPETSIDDGHISYCKETKKHYIYNSSNESTNTGKWKELSNSSSRALPVTAVSENVKEALKYLFVQGSGDFPNYSLMRDDLNSQDTLIYDDGADFGEEGYVMFITIRFNENTTLVTFSQPYINNAVYYIKVVINNNDHTFTKDGHTIMLTSDGDGTKYLSDNGSYKTINVDSDIYVIDYLSTATSGTITSEQLQELNQAIDQNKIIYYVAEPLGIAKTFVPLFGTKLLVGPDNTIGLYFLDAKGVKLLQFTETNYTTSKTNFLVDSDGTEGQVLTKTADDYAWKDLPTIGPIKDFNNAPEVVKNTFAAAIVGTAHIDNYTELEEAVGDATTTYLYNSASSGSESFDNFYITVGHYNEHILYTIFSPLMPGTYFANMYGYIAIDSAGNVERHDYTNLIQVTPDGISIHATGSASADDRDITLKTEGTGDQFLADNGQYKAIDTSSSSVILPFEKAPEVFQKFIRDGLSRVGETYTIDYADDLFSALTNLGGTVYFYSEEGIYAGYIYVSYTSSECGAMLDIPCYSNYYHLRILMTANTSGNVESQSATNALIMAENKIRLFCAINDQTDTISLDTTGDGTKYLGDDGNYHEIKQVSSYGSTADRPSNVAIGFQYFDTDLNRPIWWNGTEWVGATDANIIKLTQAQYEELPTKDPDTIYFIKG